MSFYKVNYKGHTIIHTEYDGDVGGEIDNCKFYISCPLYRVGANNNTTEADYLVTGHLTDEQRAVLVEWVMKEPEEGEDLEGEEIAGDEEEED